MEAHQSEGEYAPRSKDLVVCPVYNVTEQRPSFSLWAGWIRV